MTGNANIPLTNSAAQLPISFSSLGYREELKW